jgi:hypothetical protein
VLVTHGVSFLSQTDFIIVLANGQVSEMGHYSALLQHDGSFANFLRNYALDENMEPLEDGPIGTHHPWPSQHQSCLGSPSISELAQCRTREVLGNLGHLCDGRMSLEEKMK